MTDSVNVLLFVCIIPGMIRMICFSWFIFVAALKVRRMPLRTKRRLPNIKKSLHNKCARSRTKNEGLEARHARHTAGSLRTRVTNGAEHVLRPSRLAVGVALDCCLPGTVYLLSLSSRGLASHIAQQPGLYDDCDRTNHVLYIL